MRDYPNSEESQYMHMGLTTGICVGVAIGMVVGAALDNLGVGMCTGIGVGMSGGICIGSLLDAKKNKETENKPQEDEQGEE